MGICDIVASCSREKVDSSDLGMRDIILRDIVAQLRLHPSINTLIFAGGNSKNGPEYLFRRQLKEYGMRLACVDQHVPRKHTFLIENRVITTVSLTSPSNAANRSIGATPLYKQRKRENGSYTTLDYRIEQYRPVFTAC